MKRLLPHFDCYVIGCYPRDRLVPADWAKRVLTRGGIGNLLVVVVDGIVVGLWQQRRTGRHLEICVEAFQPLSAHQHQDLEAVIASVGEVLEAQSVPSLGAVHARPRL